MFVKQNRFIEYFKLINQKHCVINNILWTCYNRMIVPVGPIKLDYDIPQDSVKQLFRYFDKGILIRNCKGISDVPGEWYAVICNKFRSVDEVESKNRREILRGLKNCEVKKIDASEMSKSAFSVYKAAFNLYKNRSISLENEKQFQDKMKLSEPFGDIIHYWGAYYHNHMIGYVSNYIYDNIEANYSTGKFHPDFLKYYPSYALIYAMNEYYLANNKMEYVNDGFRSILHASNIQGFLIEKFGFHKAYMPLNITFRPIINFLMCSGYPIHKSLGRLDPRIAALYVLKNIERGINK